MCNYARGLIKIISKIIELGENHDHDHHKHSHEHFADKIKNDSDFQEIKNDSDFIHVIEKNEK